MALGAFSAIGAVRRSINSHEDDPVTSPILRAIGTPCLIEADVPVASLAPGACLAMKLVRTYLISCSGPITSNAGLDNIGVYGTGLTENIGAARITITESGPITSARIHNP